MDGVVACFVELNDPRASNARRDDSHGSELSGDPANAAIAAAAGLSRHPTVVTGCPFP